VQSTVDELDLQLLHLLQIAPRTSWVDAGTVLSVSPNALAARWARLTGEGLAWLSVYPNAVGAGHVTATIDVDCRPGQRVAVAETLCQDPRVVSLDECGRGRDLLLTVMVPDLTALSRMVLDDLSTIDGITGTRTSVVTGVHAEGVDWRLDALDPDQQRRIPAETAATPGTTGTAASTSPGPGGLPRDHWPLMEALSRDARLPIAELARLTDRTPATTRRQLAQLLASRALAIRCDLAPQVAGWPIVCSWLAKVRPAQRSTAIAQLRRLRQLRMCLTVTGPYNLVFTIYTRSFEALARFEDALGAAVPDLEAVETLIHLRTRKRMGWLTDPDGRATGTVVVPMVYMPDNA
jgi:DNA-binding Lrp family transcriptional regulator